MSDHDTTKIRIVSTTLAGAGTAPIIGDALRSVAPLVDAFAIVATSHDVADRVDVSDVSREHTIHDRRYRIKELHCKEWPWRDHFGDARQTALDFAAEIGADFSVMVDTDERIICPSPSAVRAFLAALPPEVHVVIAMAADGSSGRERFFRGGTPHKWIGRTHEAFPVPHGAQAIIPPTLITWDELPKSAEQLRAKNDRDVALLRAEVADHPEDGRWWYYLGCALSGIGDNDAAIESFRESADRCHDETGAMACARAAVLLADAKRFDEVIAVSARGMTLRADVAELPWMAAGASYNLGKLDQAEAWARLAQVHGYAGAGREAAATRVGAIVPHALRDGPAEVLRLVDVARGTTRRPLTPDPKPVHITVTSSAIRAAKWALRCTESVHRQSTASRHVYVAADDDTLCSLTARGYPAIGGIGKGLLANLLPIWRALPDDEVIVWLDGDDWLATDEALATVAAAHQAGALATYGSFITTGGEVCQWGPVRGAPRSAPWVSSHLKTFRAGLVKRILDADLRRADGAYLDLAIDQAIMLPILEMAAECAVYIDRCLAVYNISHSFSAGASPEDTAREHAEVARIRSRPAYRREEWSW